MSRALLIAPHADDESLFAAYLCQRYKPYVVVVYNEGREQELALAIRALDCQGMQLPVAKGADEEMVEAYLVSLRDPDACDDWDLVIAPDVEEFGHEEHNLVGRLALTVFQDIQMIRYRTYSPRGTRSHGTPVEPQSGEEISRKLLAMSCYLSQAEDRATRPWFYDLLDMREWTA